MVLIWFCMLFCTKFLCRSVSVEQCNQLYRLTSGINPNVESFMWWTGGGRKRCPLRIKGGPEGNIACREWIEPHAHYCPETPFAGRPDSVCRCNTHYQPANPITIYTIAKTSHKFYCRYIESWMFIVLKLP